MTESTQRFGKYQILAELGAGGFATVYKAVDTTLDREVALKILHPPLLTDRRFVQNFRQEAKTLAALRHPQIITIYEVGEVDGRLFIAMDLAHGVSLAQSIAKRGRILWDEMLALLKPVCEALDYAHGQNVIHRDLKPANLLLDRQRGALLTDFGFARLMAENTMSMSLSGGVVGTPGYIAPEVWEDNATNLPVDIYALGCIVYEMLTGDVLFKGQTPIQAMRAHDRGPQFPATWPEGVPAGITEVLGKALAHDPAARYPSAGAVWHALNDLEVQAQAAREAAQRTALAAQWRAEAERALAAKEWDATRMAIGRWRAVSPGDAAIQEVQAKLEQLTTQSLVQVQPTPPLAATPAEQAQMLTDMLREDVASQLTTSAESQIRPQASAARPDSQAVPTAAPNGGISPKIAAGVGGLIIVVLFAVVLFNSRTPTGPSVAPTAAIELIDTAAPATKSTPIAEPTSATPPTAVPAIATSAPDKPTPQSTAVSLADGNWFSGDSLLTPRATHSATRLPDGTVLVIGGHGIDESHLGNLDNAQIYDPGTQMWGPLLKMKQAYWNHTATLIPDTNQVLIVGTNFDDERGGAEIYDIETKAFRPTGSPQIRREWHTATVLADGSVLITGGNTGGDAGQTLTNAERYDPYTGNWQQVAPMHAARQFHSATLLPDGRVLIVGGKGSDKKLLVSAEIYDSQSNMWTDVPSMQVPREAHSATLIDQTVYVIGGGDIGNKQSLDSAEKFDLRMGQWSTISAMSTTRLAHTATALGSTILIVGGEDYVEASGVLASCELYDIATGQWQNVKSMKVARVNHTATLIDRDAVLVVGGYDTTKQFLPSVEVYQALRVP